MTPPPPWVGFTDKFSISWICIWLGVGVSCAVTDEKENTSSRKVCDSVATDHAVDRDYHRYDEQVNVCLDCCHVEMQPLPRKYIRFDSALLLTVITAERHSKNSPSWADCLSVCQPHTDDCRRCLLFDLLWHVSDTNIVIHIIIIITVWHHRGDQLCDFICLSALLK